MLQTAMGTDLTGIYSRKADAAEEERFFAMAARRASGEPLQYIIGTQPFAGLRIICRPCALIPRPETECLAEAASELLPQGGRLLDLCAGTGCIGLAVKRMRPDVSVTLTDISEECAALMRENAESNSLDAEVLMGDLFFPVRGRRFDVIACNPPYIRSGDISALQREVLHEPRLALDGGDDGLDFYRRIVLEAGEYLSPGGWIAFETGYDQTDAVAAMLSGTGFSRVSAKRDIFGQERFVLGCAEYEV